MWNSQYFLTFVWHVLTKFEHCSAGCTAVKHAHSEYVLFLDFLHSAVLYIGTMKNKSRNYQNCSMLYHIKQLCTVICTHTWAVLTDYCWFRFNFLCVLHIFSTRPTLFVLGLAFTFFLCILCLFKHFSQLSLVVITSAVDDWKDSSPEWPNMSRRGVWKTENRFVVSFQKTKPSKKLTSIQTLFQ